MAPDARAHGRFALAYASTELYGHAPWLYGYGGEIFADDGSLHVATAEAAAAAGFARKLVADGVSPAETTGQQVATLFGEGKAPMALSGPWFIGDIPAGVPWAVTTLPTVSATGRAAEPFLTAEAVLSHTERIVRFEVVP